MAFSSRGGSRGGFRGSDRGGRGYMSNYRFLLILGAVEVVSAVVVGEDEVVDEVEEEEEIEVV